MMVKYSADYGREEGFCKNRTCKQCGLYLNQPPLFDNKNLGEVIWVGLSAVQFEEGEDRAPLSVITPSGALIHAIEQPLHKSVSFYKTNLVKCVPLKEEKIRYPLPKEMFNCYPNFQDELNALKPKIVFLLGRQVSEFVFKQLNLPKPELSPDFAYQSTKAVGIEFVPVHHPSFILVYRRRQLEQYVSSVQSLIRSTMKMKRRTNSSRPCNKTVLL